MTNAQVERAIQLSGDYISRACGKSGKFVYEVYTDSGDSSTDYNLVRHAGAIYALGQLNELQPSDKAVATMTRAGEFMRRFIGPPSVATATQKMLVVWSTPVRTSRSETSLGATGLGLKALVDLKKVAPDMYSEEDLEALARFVISQQKEDGSFYSLYSLENGSKEQGERLYYPGETVLGLVSLYEADHSPEWLAAAGKAMAYLARSQPETIKGIPDHWSLLAAAKFLPHYSSSNCPVSRDVLLQSAEQLCRRILAEQITRGPEPKLVGGFDKKGRTAPTATRLEGLLAALEFIPAEHAELRSRIEKASELGVNFLVRAQIKSGRYTGGMPTAVVDDSEQGEASSTQTVRIDNVQHALSAWIGYEKMLRQNPP